MRSASPSDAAPPAHVNILIAGAGVMGAAAAFWLTSRDPSLRVLLVEREPGFARASSSLSASSIRQQFTTPVNIALSGLAGATKSLVFQLASLTDVHWSMSGEVVLMTLLGGLGTLFGPVVGAAIIVSMQNYLAQFGAWVTIIQGIIFVVCVLAFRRGIVGEIAHAIRKPL